MPRPANEVRIGAFQWAANSEIPSDPSVAPPPAQITIFLTLLRAATVEAVSTSITSCPISTLGISPEKGWPSTSAGIPK